MSNEITTENGMSFSSCFALPLLQTGLSIRKSAKIHNGVGAALEAAELKEFKKLNAKLKQAGVDIYTRSAIMGPGYEEFKEISLDAKKASNKVYKKFVKKKKTSGAKYMEAVHDAGKKADRLTDAKKGITSLGKEVLEETAKKGAKSTIKGFTTSVKNNFKKELGFKYGKLNYIMTALQFIPNIINNVIPAFKEEGIIAGLKETGKTLIQAGADLVSYAAGGAIGRAIGSAIGTIICPGAGTAIGATIGDMAGSVLVGSKVTSAVNDVLDGDENEQDAQIAQLNTQSYTAQQPAQTRLSAEQTAKLLNYNGGYNLTQEQREYIEKQIDMASNALQKNSSALNSYYA